MSYGDDIIDRINTIRRLAGERLVDTYDGRRREDGPGPLNPTQSEYLFDGTVSDLQLVDGRVVSDEVEDNLAAVESALLHLANGSAHGAQLGRPEDMHAVIEQINDDSFALLTEAKNDDIPQVKTDLNDWTGEAGTAFRAYLNDWETKAEYQLAYMQEMGQILYAVQHILKRQQKAALDIADACIEALENPGASSGGGSSVWLFVVAGAVAAVAGAPAIVGAGIAVTGAFSSYMEQKRGGTDVEDPIDIIAHDMNYLFRDVLEAIGTVWERVRGELDEVQDVAESNYNELIGDGIYKLLIERPESAYSDDWDPPESDLAVKLAQAYLAGRGHIPAATWYYTQARLELVRAMEAIRAAIGYDPMLYYKSRFDTVTDAVGGLAYVFNETASDLTDTAANLVAAVVEYAETDTSIADTFQEMRDELVDEFEVPTDRIGSAGYEPPGPYPIPTEGAF